MTEITADIDNIKLLAIAGGGAAGVASIGAAMALGDYGKLDKLEVVVGTSAGSILAAALAFGYRGNELEETVLKQEFPRFKEFSRKEIQGIKTNLEHFGVLSGDPIRHWVGNMAARRFGKSSLTFGQLKEYREQAQAGNIEFFEEKFQQAQKRESTYKKVMGKDFSYHFSSAQELMQNALAIRDLQVVASEVVKEKGRHNPMRYQQTEFNAETSPNLPIGRAVQASAAFPFAFAQAYIDGKVFTDGGMTCNIPLMVSSPEIPLENRFALWPGKVLKNSTEPLEPAPAQQTGYLKQKLSRFAEKAIHCIHIFNYRRTDIPMPDAQNKMDWWMKEWRRFKAAYHMTFNENQLADPTKNLQELLAESMFGKAHIERAHQLIDANEAEAISRYGKNILEIDRGNVESTDFHIGTKEKKWLLNSGYQAVEELMREKGIAKPEAEPEVEKSTEIVPDSRKRQSPQNHPRINRGGQSADGVWPQIW